MKEKIALQSGKFAYTLPELTAAGLGGKTTLYKDINGGRLRARKHGNRTIVLHEDATRYAESLPDYVPQADAAAGAVVFEPDPEPVVEQVDLEPSKQKLAATGNRGLEPDPANAAAKEQEAVTP